MSPQGLLVVAAYLPERWQIRFIDENIAAALAADFRWADAVLVSGMHVQRGQIEDIIRRASSSRARVLHARVRARGRRSVVLRPDCTVERRQGFLGCLARVRPELVVALVLRQARRNLFAMKEVAHDAIGDGPIVAVDAVVMRAEARVTRELKTARCAKAHASRL